jgi:hypothetical protein
MGLENFVQISARSVVLQTTLFATSGVEKFTSEVENPEDQEDLRRVRLKSD